MNNKPKVLILTHHYLPFAGGAEVTLDEITKRVKDFDFDIVTAKISDKLPYRESIGGVNIYRLGVGGKSDKYFFAPRAFLFARRAHKKGDYQIIWAMMASWAGIAALLFKMFFPRVKYLLTLQEGDSEEFLKRKTWFWRPIYALIYKKADYIQVISKWLERRARDYGYKGEIGIVPNGVNIEQFKIERLKCKFNEDNLRKALHIPMGVKIIFTASRLVEKNDMETLIKAMGILIMNDKLPVALVIAGGGKLENKLKSLARDLGIEDKVIFLGQLSPEDVRQYYTVADIFARPSLSEGFGNSFIEAMAAGVPVVATAVGGIVDFLIDKKTGLFCKIKNKEDLAEKIKLLLIDKKIYQEIRENGLRLVEDKYDWRIIANKMEKIFEKMMQVC